MGITKPTYYRHIHSQASEPSNRTIHNQPGIKEPRGRPRKITATEINMMERIVEEADVQERAMTWACLGYEAGIEDVYPRTI